MCLIPNCQSKAKRKVHGHGMCAGHLRKFRRWGDPLAPDHRGRARTGGITNTGYGRITVDDGRRLLEHRAVMEQKLGRRLLPHEVIHHINGIKTDNRLENLELTTHPSHARHHKSALRREIVDADVIAMYQGGMSMRTIANKYKSSPSTIQNRLVKARIPTRPQGWNFAHH